MRIVLRDPILSFAGLAFLLFLLTACDRFPTEPDASPSGSLTLSSSRNALPADGFSSVELIARVAPDAVRAGREVSFTTTEGAFAGAVSTSATTLKVPLAADGTARALLRSSQRPGRVLVSAKVVSSTDTLTAEARLDLTFEVPDSDGLRFVSAPSSLPADGESAVAVTVSVPAELPLNDRTVAFATTRGTFEGASNTAMVVAGADGVARALLTAGGATGTGLLSATAGSFRIETLIELRHAFPDSLRLEVPSVIAQNATATVRVVLLRRTGTPTAGTAIDLVARDSTGAPFGSFRSVTLSDAMGVVTATFSPDGGGTLGTATIEATVSGRGLRATQTFELEAPPEPASS